MDHDAQLVAIDTLKPYKGNARVHNLDVIRESLRVNKQYRPVVVRAKTREVLAGNGTLKAAVEEGWTELWATFVDVDAKAAKRIVLVDNRSNDLAGYDNLALRDLLEAMPSLEGTGYDDVYLAGLVEQLDPATTGDTDPGDPPAAPRTKPGDLYVLGEHRLLCGDSSDPLALDRVFAGATVGCVLTDPPYGMNLDTDWSKIGGSNKAILKGTPGGKYRAVAGDNEAFDAGFLATYFASVKEQFWFGADYYRRTLTDDDRDGSWLVWDKRNESADAGFGSGFELIWSKTPHKRDLLRHYYSGAFGAEGRDRQHPTQKPTPMLGEILTRWAPEACIVADPFLGSGSTLLACENTGRSCHGLELEPGYCDVIVDRWERHTGKQARLASD